MHGVQALVDERQHRMRRRDTPDGYPRLTVAIVRGLKWIADECAADDVVDALAVTKRQRREAAAAVEYIERLIAAYQNDGRL